MIDKNNYDLLNGADLAYIGDAYYELRIRLHLINKGVTKTKELNKYALLYVSAKGQSKIMKELLPNLTEEETNIYKRGRNSVSGFHRKNVLLSDYQAATGYEALLGYLYLQNKLERIDEIINYSIKIIEEN